MSILTELKEFIENKGGDSSDISTIAEAIDAIDQQGIGGGSRSGASANGVFFIDLNYSGSGFASNQKWSDVVNAFQNGMALVVRVISPYVDNEQVTGKRETYFNYVEIDSDQNGIPKNISVRSSSSLPQDETVIHYQQIAIDIMEGDNDNVVANMDYTLTFETELQILSSN